jgi:hypothetical protein
MSRSSARPRPMMCSIVGFELLCIITCTNATVTGNWAHSKQEKFPHFASHYLIPHHAKLKTRSAPLATVNVNLVAGAFDAASAIHPCHRHQFMGFEGSREITYTNPHRIHRASCGSCLRLWRTTRANIGQRSNRYVSLRQFLGYESGFHCAGMELEAKDSYYDMKAAVLQCSVLVLHVAGSPNAVIHWSVVASSCTRERAKTLGITPVGRSEACEDRHCVSQTTCLVQRSLLARHTEPV